MKILLIEDEIELRVSIAEYLSKEGYICETAINFEQAIEKIFTHNYECIIVDLMLPGGSGLDIIKQIKQNDISGGIIILSAKNSLDDKILGLEIGSDDYLTKPFFLPELNARVKSIIRRKNFEGKNEIIFNEIRVSESTRRIFVNNSPLDVTKMEYDLLLYFLGNIGIVLTKESIAENLLGDNADLMDSFNFIYTHIKNLRKKIISAGGGDYIKTVYSIGYKFGE